MTDMLVRPVLDDTDTDNPDDHAHIVPADQVMEATVMGTPLTALCGFVFVPTKDHERLPLCQECKERYDRGERPPRKGVS